MSTTPTKSTGKKKRRTGSVSAKPQKTLAAGPLPHEGAAAQKSGNAPVTTGTFVLLVVAGFGLGGLGGYLLRTPGEGSVATKDATTSAQPGSTQAPKAGAADASKPQARQPQQQQAATQPGAYVPLAAWTPREGPEHAKVTIIEFSDFQ